MALDKKSFIILVSLILLAALFIILEYPPLQLICLILLLGVQIYSDWFYWDRDVSKFSKGMTTFIFSAYVILYIGVISKDIAFMSSAIYLFLYSLIAVLIWRVLTDLLKLEELSIPKIIVSYFFVMFFIGGLFFGATYALVGSINDASNIYFSNGEKISSISGYIYFGIINFYSANLGEKTGGFTAILVLIELFISFIIHAVVIARAVNSLPPRRR